MEDITVLREFLTALYTWPAVAVLSDDQVRTSVALIEAAYATMVDKLDRSWWPAPQPV